MAEPDRVKVLHRLAGRRGRAWIVGAVLAGLLVLVAGLVLGPDSDPLFLVLLGLGAAATVIVIIGLAGELAGREPAPTDAIPASEDVSSSRPVAIPVEGDHDTLTVNIFHLLRASWVTTVDLADGTSLVAGADGDVLEVRDSDTGLIAWAKVDTSGAVSVGSESEVPIIVGALRALADQLMGAGFAYEPSVTARAEVPQAVAAGSAGPRDAP